MSGLELRQKIDLGFFGKIGIFVIFSLVAIELIDTVIGNISDFQYDPKYSFLNLFLTTQAGTNFFVVLFCLFIVIQFISLYYIRFYLKYESQLFAVFYKVTLFLHFVMIAILVLAVLDIVIYNQYAFYLSKIAVGIGSTFASIIFFLLSKRLFDWYKKVNNKLILLFGFAFLLLGITKVIFELGIFLVLYEYDEVITSNTIVEFPDYTRNAVLSFFQDSYWIFAVTSFFLLWLSTVFLIQNYKKTIGKNKYRMLTVLSLLVFVPTPIGIYVNESDIGNIIDPVIFYTFTTFNATIAAILFFITFSSLSKSITHEYQLKNYLFITGIGLLLYFISDQSTIEQHAYPPYGMISLVFLGYSAYLIFIGILSSAISLSRNVEVRRVVHDILRDRFLYDISLGELYTESESHVKKVISKIPKSDLATDVVPLESAEVHGMVDEVISQLQDIRVEEDFRKGYYVLQLDCLKCHKYYRIQVNLSENTSVHPTYVEYPKSEKFECDQCGNLIGLNGSSQLIVRQYNSN